MTRKDRERLRRLEVQEHMRCTEEVMKLRQVYPKRPENIDDIFEIFEPTSGPTEPSTPALTVEEQLLRLATPID